MNQNREFIYKRIGAKVAYFRISNGLTQEEIMKYAAGGVE